MKHGHSQPRFSRTLLACALAAAGWLAAAPANAGGLLLYEIGTEDVGLASAGYTARAQDASTVFTNPAGMTRLDGTQTTTAAAGALRRRWIQHRAGHVAGLGSGDGGNPVSWFPGGGGFVSYSVSPDLKLGFGATGNFGLALNYDSDWVGRYYVQEGTLVGLQFVPSVAYRVSPQWSVGASLNAMYAKMRTQVAVNNLGGADGMLVIDDYEWGFGGTLGVLYEPSPRTRFGLVWNSQIKLDFSTTPEFTGLSHALDTVITNRGLNNTNLNLGMTVPQGVNASFFHQADDRWALLGSVGWQQWSKFGYVEVGVESSNPVSLTKNLDFKDTWHVAAGAQYQMDSPWRLDFGVAYDSEFQDSSSVSPLLPANSAWRFGIGAQKQESKTFSWGLAAEYVYGGNLDVNKHSDTPVALGGRGDLIGSYDNVGIFFLATNFNWKF